MKKYTYISFTAGRGPEECGLANQGIQMRFQKYLTAQEITYEVISEQYGSNNHTLETIVFKIGKGHRPAIEPWLGTIQWICKSPIRKYSKRKNWYIKCCEVLKPEPLRLNLKDITVQVYKASGAGGQHRNKVETAIRIIHNPTGTIVTASETKSKAQNKKRALEKLEEKLTLLSRRNQADHSLDEWASKLEVERGNPSKVFYGLRFLERQKQAKNGC